MRRFALLAGQSLRALAENRLRTTLSVLGIMIGIAAVIAISSVSRGGQYVVLSELETFGLRSVWVYRDWRSSNPNQRQREGSGIELADVRALQARQHPKIARLTPLVYPGQRNVRIRHQANFASANLLGAGKDYFAIVNDRLAAGRYFLPQDIQQNHRVALLAPDVARQLFGQVENLSSLLGRRFDIAERQFEVIGVLKPKSRDFLASIGSVGGRNANERIIVPFTALQKINANERVGTLQLEASSLEDAALVAADVKTFLQHRHRGLFQYSSETMADHIKTTERILGAVGIIGVIASSISLLVGGIGIMSIMSTAVVERTREIGLRKAVGASEQDILWQFLCEAVLLSLCGGCLGVIVGGSAGVVLAKLTDFPLAPTLSSVLVALGVSVVVGLLSGVLPARRAARLHPATALRHE